jgi:hypothetical protein
MIAEIVIYIAGIVTLIGELLPRKVLIAVSRVVTGFFHSKTV